MFGVGVVGICLVLLVLFFVVVVSRERWGVNSTWRQVSSKVKSFALWDRV